MLGPSEALGVNSRGRLSPEPQEGRRSVLARRDYGHSCRSVQRYLTLSNQLSPLMILERSGRWPSRGQMTGMLGTYLFGGGRADTAGLVVSMASRNARGADLLVADQDCQRAWSIRVKTNRKPASLAAQQRLSRGFVRDAYLSLRESARRCQAGLLHCSEPRREEAWRNEGPSGTHFRGAMPSPSRRMRSVANSSDRAT